MDIIEQLVQKESITSGEAVLAIISLCRKYNCVLDNVIRIKRQHEEGDDKFRRSSPSTTELLVTLQGILHELHDESSKIAKQIQHEIADKGAENT